MRWLRWLVPVAALQFACGMVVVASGWSAGWTCVFYEALDRWCFHADDGVAEVCLLPPGGADEKGASGGVGEVRGAPGRVEMLAVDARQLGEVFPESPAMQWAVLLRHLRQRGVDYLGVSSPFEGGMPPGELESVTLRVELESFPLAVFGLRGALAASAEPVPEAAVSSALPQARVSGNLDRLPSVNRMLPTALCRGGWLFPATWCIDWVSGDERFFDRADGRKSIPLLVRWNGHVYPSMPLRVALAKRGLKPDDVQACIGAWLRLGGELELPMDEQGRISLSGGSDCREVSLDEVMEGRSGREQCSAGGVLLVEEATLESRDHLRLMADTVSRLTLHASSEEVQDHVNRAVLRAWDLRWFWGCAVVLLGGMIFVLPLCARRVHVWGERAVFVSVPVLVVVLCGQGIWFPCIGLVAGVAAAAFAARKLRGYWRRCS